MSTITVAVPVLDGGPLLGRVLGAVRAQRVDREVELLVSDSGSSDGSREVALAAGARVIDIAPGDFSHGGTRNRLVAESAGDQVAFLTQDSMPGDDRWLARLLSGFELADDVGLVFGPYRPREDASPMVRRELEAWFSGFAPDGQPRIDRGADPASPRRGFFTDANGAIARRAWEHAPFRRVAYAEDQMLARDMLAAGWAKVYVPSAEVIHSHEYGVRDTLGRSFDEWRGLREVAGVRAHARLIDAPLTVQRSVRDDLALLAEEGCPLRDRLSLLPRSAVHHGARELGAVLGSRADRVPRRVRGRLSLEGRDGFAPAEDQLPEN